MNEGDTSHSMNTHTSKEVIDTFKENIFEHCNLLTDQMIKTSQLENDVLSLS